MVPPACRSSAAAAGCSARWCAATPTICRRRCARWRCSHALSAKAKDGGIIVLDKASVKEPKTKALVAQFGKLGLVNALIIDGAEIETNFRTAARNIPNIDVLPVQGINVYDIMRRKTLVLTKAALDALEARFK